MSKKFATFADNADSAKAGSDFNFDAYHEKMRKVARDARRHQALAIQSAKDVWVGR